MSSLAAVETLSFFTLGVTLNIAMSHCTDYALGHSIIHFSIVLNILSPCNELLCMGELVRVTWLVSHHHRNFEVRRRVLADIFDDEPFV